MCCSSSAAVKPFKINRIILRAGEIRVQGKCRSVFPGAASGMQHWTRFPGASGAPKPEAPERERERERSGRTNPGPSKVPRCLQRTTDDPPAADTLTGTRRSPHLTATELTPRRFSSASRVRVVKENNRTL